MRSSAAVRLPRGWASQRNSFSEKAKDEAGKKKLAEEFRKDLIAAMCALLEAEGNLVLAAGKVNEAATKLEVIGEMAEKAHTAPGVE